ncbi:hypothetical protein B488_00120 [Liberibacter crescens BT-1]|uniref:Outer membrane lipoprotein carrier protein LolA n=1 Tax=Liberibacter crescens (strain BT-1) TaxID=1215343 RepID=L0ET66_LIBCB|nr:outer-membrane lipoprotein carrier protein LolA [Liberibacter crescens]AGA64005.1 hypothetical protein B488_00120 [Liberibacter crescens BT-1]AMC12315.1 hypothetical protein RL73_00245 [Liberibacter crescens]
MDLLIFRKKLILGLIIFITLISSLSYSFHAKAAVKSENVRKLFEKFSSIRTMQGKFIQIGSRGEERTGKFFIERPGKLRFDYDNPYKVKVIADGKNVAIGNSELKTWDIYPLSKTPLNFILSSKLDMNDSIVSDIKEEKDFITIILSEKNSKINDYTISLIFDTNNYELFQWTVKDSKGDNTSVSILEVKNNIDLNEKLFKIPYDEVHN